MRGYVSEWEKWGGIVKDVPNGTPMYIMTCQVVRELWVKEIKEKWVKNKLHTTPL